MPDGRDASAQIVEEIGGGVAGGRQFKAVQVGGPSGGCVPAELADTPVDYEALAAVGAIMGSGGLVVLDDTDCMVDIARYFLRFTQDQSCGKCTFCRVGTRRMLDILDRICTGHGRPGDLEQLEQLSPDGQRRQHLRPGQDRAQPRALDAAVLPRRVRGPPAGPLPGRQVQGPDRVPDQRRLHRLHAVRQHCPVDAIPMTPYARHTIDLEKCTRCDTCRQVCPEQAVYRGVRPMPIV